MLKILCTALLALLLFALPAHAQSVTADFNSTIETGSPYVFGVNYWPCTARAADCWGSTPAPTSAQTDLLDFGVKHSRSDFIFESLFNGSGYTGSPNPATLAGYQNAMAKGCPAGSECDPSTWNWHNTGSTCCGGAYTVANDEVMGEAKASGLDVLAIIDYPPPWLASASDTGTPTDWSVWHDMITKAIQHYQPGEVEVWNEPDNFGPLTPHQYVNIYNNSAPTVRSVNPKIKIGGPATDKNNSNYVSAMQSGIAANLIDFYSFHSYCGFTLCDSSIPMPGAIMSEWNYGSEPTHGGNAADSVAFVGWGLISALNNGMYAADFYNGTNETGGGAYALFDANWNPLNKAYAFKLLSTDLGLGAGVSSIKATTSSGLAAALAAVNSAGQSVVAMVNDSASDINVPVDGLPSGSYRVYLADDSANHAGAVTQSGTESGSVSVSMTPYSVAGVVVGANNPTPTPTPSPPESRKPRRAANAAGALRLT